jgi:hypothetical protein
MKCSFVLGTILMFVLSSAAEFVLCCNYISFTKYFDKLMHPEIYWLISSSVIHVAQPLKDHLSIWISTIVWLLEIIHSNGIIVIDFHQ